MKRNKLRGFSLMEMMVALFIMAVVMCTAIVAFSKLQAMGKKTEMVMTACNLAQQRMEVAMREPFETLDTLDDDETWQYIDRYGNDYVGDAPEINADFRRMTTIINAFSDDSSLTQVTVAICYKTYTYRVGGGTAFGLNILTGELIEKDWSPFYIEFSTVMVDN